MSLNDISGYADLFSMLTDVQREVIMVILDAPKDAIDDVKDENTGAMTMACTLRDCGWLSNSARKECTCETIVTGMTYRSGATCSVVDMTDRFNSLPYLQRCITEKQKEYSYLNRFVDAMSRMSRAMRVETCRKFGIPEVVNDTPLDTTILLEKHGYTGEKAHEVIDYWNSENCNRVAHMWKRASRV